MRTTQGCCMLLQNSSCTATYKMLGEKARWELHKDAACCFKTAAVQLLTSYLTNHPSKTNKTCWALLVSKDDILLWTPKHEQTSVDWLAKTYIHQFYVDTGCRLEDLLVGIDGKRTKRIHIVDMPRWWYICIYNRCI